MIAALPNFSSADYGSIDRAAMPRANTPSRALAFIVVTMLVVIATSTSRVVRSTATESLELIPGVYRSDDGEKPCIDQGTGFSNIAYAVQQVMGYAGAVFPAAGVLFSDRGQYSMYHAYRDPIQWGQRISAHYDSVLASVADNSYCDPSFHEFAKCTNNTCLLYTSPSPRDGLLSRMPSSA